MVAGRRLFLADTLMVEMKSGKCPSDWTTLNLFPNNEGAHMEMEGKCECKNNLEKVSKKNRMDANGWILMCRLLFHCHDCH